mmetsp:Transcript_125415/g.217441  ORF Transcript_125415/g.217441 Transcript_125415/m.217441 type:complete len:268 (+) Transcript_125415:1189-1992(+)
MPSPCPPKMIMWFLYITALCPSRGDGAQPKVLHESHRLDSKLKTCMSHNFTSPLQPAPHRRCTTHQLQPALVLLNVGPAHLPALLLQQYQQRLQMLCTVCKSLGSHSTRPFRQPGPSARCLAQVVCNTLRSHKAFKHIPVTRTFQHQQRQRGPRLQMVDQERPPLKPFQQLVQFLLPDTQCNEGRVDGHVGRARGADDKDFGGPNVLRRQHPPRFPIGVQDVAQAHSIKHAECEAAQATIRGVKLHPTQGKKCRDNAGECRAHCCQH